MVDCMPLILKLHIFSTIFMTGLIWCIQIVHYPLFSLVEEKSFKNYQSSHQRRISIVVLPIMLLELGTGILLMLQSQTFDWYITMGLLALIWLSTFLLQVPCHQKLSHGYSATVLKRLVISNWIRTLLWTARAFIFVSVM
ncbi:MAG: hypothetical protein KDK51_04115 [Deltaproteobacteria bacterium]|nr:hypothetical protein [Deltaproteobacteria bacterium]